jgi:hypothetical protein
MVNRAQEFSNPNEINAFFQKYNASGFVNWFNKNIAGDSNWGIKISNEDNWQKLWANINILFGKKTINLVEFLCMNSVFINETGGKFQSLTENVGSSGHPGISYAFDVIPGTKKSYNTLDTNRTALQLFNDPIYINAHGHKPYGNILKNTTDTRWSGDLFPIGFSGNKDQEVNKSGKTNTFLTEADYYKFRGRGYIQTTGREVYKSLIKFVLSYTGEDPLIKSTRDGWKKIGDDIDDIASHSSNDEWDNLFQKSNSIIANYAAYVHSTLPSVYKNYNIINPNQSDLNLHKSIRKVGLGVSGANSYADTFVKRVIIQLDKLDSMSTDTTKPISETPVAATQSEPGRLETTGQDPTSQVGSDSNITGSLSIVTNLFKPTAKPGPISFNI